MTAAPLIGLSGFLFGRAELAEYRDALKTAGRALVAISVVGTAAMPRSVFRQSSQSGPGCHSGRALNAPSRIGGLDRTAR